MLTPKKVAYIDLLLDPNNPRLARQFGNSERLEDNDIERVQPELEELFGIPPERGEQQGLDRLIGDEAELSSDDFFSIKELKASMRRIGFVGIQNIIVREINNTSKYLVIEGNRRVASIKAILREHETATLGDDNRIDDAGKRATLTDIQVMVLQSKGLDSDKIDETISKTLGLRHYGSQLKWDLLPRAKNIYDEYIKVASEPFEYTPENGKYVAGVMAIKTSDAKRLLRGFLCYKQLTGMYRVRPHHFSLILAAIENSHLNAYEYFKVDGETFKLMKDTAEKLDRLCEFEERDRTDFIKIINDPKEFKKLGLILKDSKLSKSESIRNYAQGLFAEVVGKQLSLNDAYTELVGFKKRHQWVQAIKGLLKKQADDNNLNLERFLNQGQELKLRDDLLKLTNKFLMIMEG